MEILDLIQAFQKLKDHGLDPDMLTNKSNEKHRKSEIRIRADSVSPINTEICIRNIARSDNGIASDKVLRVLKTKNFRE